MAQTLINPNIGNGFDNAVVGWTISKTDSALQRDTDAFGDGFKVELSGTSLGATMGYVQAYQAVPIPGHSTVGSFTVSAVFNLQSNGTGATVTVEILDLGSVVGSATQNTASGQNVNLTATGTISAGSNEFGIRIRVTRTASSFVAGWYAKVSGNPGASVTLPNPAPTVSADVSGRKDGLIPFTVGGSNYSSAQLYVDTVARTSPYQFSLPPGSHNAYVIATHPWSASSGQSSTISFTVANVAPVFASVGAVAGSGYDAGLVTVTQNTASAGAQTQYTFNWGDGSPNTVVAKANAASVQHQYATPGAKTITITADDPWYNGTDPTTTTNVTVPTRTAPEPNFTYVQDGADASVLNFTGSSNPSYSNGLTWAWNFGDGGTATGKTPSHSFAVAGAYEVTLTLTDAFSSGSPLSITKTVNVGTPPASPAFTVEHLANRTVKYTVTNYDNRFTYTWNFGDGNSSSTVSPTHQYAASGTYTAAVTLNSVPPRTTSQIVSVPTQPVVFKKPGDVLRLEYARPLTQYANKLSNPSGKYGASGWLTPIAGSVIVAETSAATGNQLGLKYTSVADAGGNYFYSEAFRVDPGKYVRAMWYSYAGSVGHKVRVQWLDANGSVLSSTAYTSNFSSGVTLRRTTAAAAPANTVFARLEFRLVNATTGAEITAAGSTLSLREVSAAVGTTVSSSLDNQTFNEGVEWVNILNPTTSVKFTREALNLGTLQAIVKDAGLDPARYPDIKRGVRVRLTVNTGITYDSLFEGKIDNAKVTYVRGTRITMTLVDPTNTLAQIASPGGTNSVSELPALLEGSGVPWNVNGNSGQVGTFTLASYNEKASLLDQIAMTRDTAQAEAWVDRYGVLQVRSGGSIVNTPKAVLAEAQYSDINIGYNTNALINSVLVKVLELDPVSLKSIEVTYGPYEADQSILDNGIFQTTVTIHDGVNPESVANAILNANMVPVVTATSVTVPVKSNAGLSLALLDVYDRVTINNVESNFSKIGKISAVTHDIDPYGWRVTYAFDDPNSVAIPSKVPSPDPQVTTSTGGGGVTDHGALTGLADDDHPQYLNNARGDARYAPAAHNHDDRYFTETEADARFQPINTVPTHNHDSLYWSLSNVSAKGDIPVATADDTVGIQTATGAANGDVLTRDSSTATGVKWAAPPGAGGNIDHGTLQGLSDDDHPQYHTDSRGDARYQRLAQAGSVLTDAITANVANSTTTLATSGLTASLVAGGVYNFRAVGQYQTAATTTGILITPVAASGSWTSVRANLTIWGAATSANTPQKQNITASGGGAVTTGVFAATTPYHFELEGTVVVNAAGTLDIQFRSEVASSAATMLAPLSLVVTRVA